MTHIMFIFYLFGFTWHPVYVSNTNEIFIGFGVILFCYLVSIPISIVFEAPFVNIEKILFHSKPVKGGESEVREPLKLKDQTYSHHIDESTLSQEK